MSTRKTKASTNATDELATLVVEKVSDQIKTLVARNWPEIGRILRDEEEIKMSFGVAITDRIPKPGEQADKDNRVQTTISFSIKFSDKIEGELPDPNQMELGENNAIE